ncbi:MAG: TolC family protein [Nevskia sp.]|nr:TolC family protein [Nevskia sp.]
MQGRHAAFVAAIEGCWAAFIASRRRMAPSSGTTASVALCTALLAACAAVPPRTPPDPAATAQAFAARRLDNLSPNLPPPASGWDRAQWLNAALLLNPQLAEERARATAVAAGERTAAQIRNPTLNLFGEYITAAAGGAAWLYGLSMDFLLQRPGDRSRAKRSAALETQAAQSDVAESIWQVRTALRQSLLDVVYARDEAALLQQLVAAREKLQESARANLDAGEIAGSEALRTQLELSAARQRLNQVLMQDSEAQGRLAAAVGVPAAALDGVPLRWPQWDRIAALYPDLSGSIRQEALIDRPDLVRALREYDLAETTLQSEVARRWPEFHITPGYAWDNGGVRENQLNETLHDNELGMSLELPIFNRNEGPIGEAVARRELAGKHLESIQAGLFMQMEQAERNWPRARLAWEDATAAAVLAQQRRQAEQRALSAGASDRPTLLLAQAEAIETQLLGLQAAYAAQQAFAALEDAYRRPLEGPECAMPLSWRTEKTS